MKLSTICTGLAYTLAVGFVQAFPTPADDATLSPYPDTYAERLNQVAQVFMSMSRNFKETTDNIPRECLTPNAQFRAGEREEAASCQLMKKDLEQNMERGLKELTYLLGSKALSAETVPAQATRAPWEDFDRSYILVAREMANFLDHAEMHSCLTSDKTNSAIYKAIYNGDQTIRVPGSLNSVKEAYDHMNSQLITGDRKLDATATKAQENATQKLSEAEMVFQRFEENQQQSQQQQQETQAQRARHHKAPTASKINAGSARCRALINDFEVRKASATGAETQPTGSRPADENRPANNADAGSIEGTNANNAGSMDAEDIHNIINSALNGNNGNTSPNDNGADALAMPTSNAGGPRPAEVNSANGNNNNSNGPNANTNAMGENTNENTNATNDNTAAANTGSAATMDNAQQNQNQQQQNQQQNQQQQQNGAAEPMSTGSATAGSQ